MSIAGDTNLRILWLFPGFIAVTDMQACTNKSVMLLRNIALVALAIVVLSCSGGRSICSSG